MNSVSLYRKLAGASGILFIGKGMALVSSVIFARYLGTEQYGLYGFTISIITIATLPVIAGLPNLLIREIANFQLENKWRLLIGIIKWSRYYVIVISILSVFVVLVGLHYDLFEMEVSNLLWIALLLIPIKGLLTQQGAIFNGFRKPMLAQFPLVIIIPFIEVVIVAVIISYNVKMSAINLVYVTLLASIFALFVSVILLKLILKLESRSDKPLYNIRGWHCSLLPFTAMALVSTLNAELASVLLGRFDSYESVAIFKVGMQTVSVISMGLAAVNTVIMPNVAIYYKQGDLVKTQQLLTKSVRISTIVSIPVVLMLMFGGDIYISLLYGDQYLLAYPILVIVTFGQLVNVSMGSVGLVLNMTGNENKTLKSLLYTLIVNVVVMLILIPLYGAIGAAISVLIGLTLWNVLMSIDVWKITRLKPWFHCCRENI